MRRLISADRCKNSTDLSALLASVELSVCLHQVHGFAGLEGGGGRSRGERSRGGCVVGVAAAAAAAAVAVAGAVRDAVDLSGSYHVLKRRLCGTGLPSSSPCSFPSPPPPPWACTPRPPPPSPPPPSSA